MNKIFKKLLFPCLIVAYSLFSLGLKSQNLEKVGDKDMLKISGGIGFNSMLYNSFGTESQREPFIWNLSGNITANFLDVSLPFVFNYSNNHLSYSQPLNFQSLNPKYKWLQAYIGNTSMSMSKYTLSGHMFSGAGLELTPGSFKFAFMYGRLLKAIELSADSSNIEQVCFRRMGAGVSAEYNKNGKDFKLIYFTAKDDELSLMFRPAAINLQPMQNSVLSAIVKYPLPAHISFESEFALSGITRNTGYEGADSITGRNYLPVIFRINPTSSFYKALRTSIAYSLKSFRLSINYERIDPGYKTLGTYYFTNDCENITMAPSFVLFKGKLNISANTGLQRDNLYGNKISTSRRLIGSANFSYTPGKKWMINGNYSNFSSYTRFRNNSDPFNLNPLDTMNIYIVSKSAMIGGNYKFGKENIQHTLSFNGNYQNSGQQQGSFSDPGLSGATDEEIINPANVYCGIVSWNMNFKKSKTSVTAAFNTNLSKMVNAETLFLGPTASFNRSIIKNTLKITVSTTYNKMFVNDVQSRELINYRIGLGYTPKKNADKKRGAFSMNTNFGLLQKLKSPTVAASCEFTGNIGLNYSF